MLKGDVEDLRGSNNFVEIFNTGSGSSKRSMLLFSTSDVSKKFPGRKKAKASDPKTLLRVKEFTAHWFYRMRQRLKYLGLLAEPREVLEDCILIADKGCRRQKVHYDFNPKKVQKLIGNCQYNGVPLSVLCSFTPTGSSLRIADGFGCIKEVHLNCGDMIIFTGDLLHGGAAYNEFNLRGFFHVHHPTLLPFDPDTVFLQLAPASVRNPKAKKKNAANVKRIRNEKPAGSLTGKRIRNAPDRLITAV